MSATSPQQHIILEPPRLMKGRVTPVHGSRSVAPKTCSAVWNNNKVEAAHAAIE